MSKYFTESEMACKCCGQIPPQGVDPHLYELLDDIRERAGQPLILSCACRCPAHNAEVGGVPNSQHVTGQAADIIVPDDMTVEELACIAEEMGADGVGRYLSDGFVHVDVRSGRCADTYRWTVD